MERRKFIQNTSLLSAGSLTILNFPVFGKNAPSNKVVVAVMGLNSRGAYHVEKFGGIPGVEVAYLCDVEDGAIQKGLKAAKNGPKTPTVEKDIRKLVTKTDFDALVVAAPDHWHAPAALLGVANGKHVYVEKPCSHNPNESEILIRAQAKYGKIIQVGSQRRSFPTLIEAVKQVRAGLIGNPYMAKGWYTNNRKAIGVGKIIPAPTTLD
jgi:predicted dehydrogenase